MEPECWVEMAPLRCRKSSNEGRLLADLRDQIGQLPHIVKR